MRNKTPIPIGWEEMSLKELGDFKNGVNKAKEDFGFGKPFVNLMDIFGKPYLKNQHFSLVNVTVDEILNYDLKEGDVLFVRSSVKPEGVGLTTLIEEDLPQTVYSGFIIRFREKGTKLTYKYKKYCFNSPLFRKRLIAKSSISANTNINQGALNTLTIIFPSRQEQEKIVEVLETWDSYLEKLIDTIKCKKAIKKDLMHKLLEGKMRVPGFSKRWELKPLSFYINLTLRPVSKPDTNFMALGIRSHCKGTFQKRDFDPNKIAMDILYKAQKDDLIVNITFAWEGAIAIVKQEDSGGLVSHRFPTYVFKKNIGCAAYFRQFIQTKRLRHLLKLISPAGAGRNRVMSKKDFLNLKVQIPDYEEQVVIAQILTIADQEIEALEKKRTLIEEQKRFLLNSMITGELRLPEFTKISN